MQDTELFLSLAEIAGVFVGFGALIAVRSNAPTDTYEVAYIGLVVWQGVAVIAMALMPIAISRFGVTDHRLWLVCSLLALALFWVGNEVVSRVFNALRSVQRVAPLKRRAKVELVAMALWLPANAALVLAALGVFANQEPALYLATTTLFLLMDAMIPLMTVFGLGRWATT